MSAPELDHATQRALAADANTGGPPRADADAGGPPRADADASGPPRADGSAPREGGDPSAGPAGLPLPGRYEDLGPIGGGSFGEVRRVRDTLLDRVVAMKILRAEHAGLAHVRRRFLVEAHLTADLQHPGIVALHDRGELPDHRLWFTMKEVRGRTLGDVIHELHAARTVAFVPAPSGWTFRRLVDAFARIVQAVAYAHRHGVVHRDLKPDNLMVGEFGEVLVMDWGLARRITAPGDGDGDGDELAGDAATRTHHGDILGTPAYMAPEQATGDTARHGPPTDVYALGAVLHCLLTGLPPHRGSVDQILAALAAGPPVKVADAAPGGPPLPAELVAVCERALRRDIAERYPTAEAMADDVVAWLDGVRRRDQALAALDAAQALAPEIAALRARAELAEARARALHAELRPFDPIDRKRPAWQLEDEAARLGRTAALTEARWLAAVQGALSVDPELDAAHAVLADHHRARLLDAELGRRDEDAARAEELLRIHDRGRHAAFLRGGGALTLVTDPPGAEVGLERFVLDDRRRIAVPDGVLGATPLHAARLPHGSYLLRIRAPGCAEVRYPVLIDRAGHWDGCAPGDAAARPIALPAAGALGPDDVYVPAGWCWTGGDAAIPDSLPRRRIWIDGFVVRRFPVTAAEYLAFLNDLVAHGRDAEAELACPRAQASLVEGGRAPALVRDTAGRYGLPPDRDGLRWRPDWPIVLVSWHAAVGYARWLAARTGQPWRLLDELEREKATRGVDGRLLPWGDHPEPTFACVADTAPGEPSREAVHGHPTDDSPYGVRGLAGNTRDWCSNVWTHGGPRVEHGRLCLEPAAPDDPDFRVIKGGAWSSAAINGLAAARFGARPGAHRPVVGFRVARIAGES
ncbi:MAG TPA: bifunctional serine/threonine-protein kinase/formylglycine-generating enzyme family protein [Kofleriaceae bacterium]|nr:bifunctional serine/threonine-protein kinase/formylglycine-generating enzyme family protein [Kofleriaceae bacterium]